MVQRTTFIGAPDHAARAAARASRWRKKKDAIGRLKEDRAGAFETWDGLQATSPLTANNRKEEKLFAGLCRSMLGHMGQAVPESKA